MGFLTPFVLTKAVNLFQQLLGSGVIPRAFTSTISVLVLPGKMALPKGLVER